MSEESFGILLRALPDKSVYVEAKFLSDGKDIGRHKLGTFKVQSESKLREALMVAINNWLDTRVHRTPAQRMSIEDEQRKAIADFNAEWGERIRMEAKKVVNGLPEKSVTDDQSICEHSEPESLSGEQPDDLLDRGSVALEGERAPVEQAGDGDGAGVPSDGDGGSIKHLVISNPVRSSKSLFDSFNKSPWYRRYELRDGECVDVSIGNPYPDSDFSERLELDRKFRKAFPTRDPYDSAGPTPERGGELEHGTPGCSEGDSSSRQDT